MKNCAAKLWFETDAAIISAELIIVMTLLVIGVCVGVKSVRDSIVTELADVAQAIANFDQSFFSSGVSGHSAASAGSEFIDRADYCDKKNITGDEQQSKCVVVGDAILHPVVPNGEGSR